MRGILKPWPPEERLSRWPSAAEPSPSRDRISGDAAGAGDSEFLLREAGGVSHRGHPALRPGTFPPFTRTSSTADLVHALDTGEPPRGGVRSNRANLELIFACIESHRRGGARVALSLAGSDLRLERDIASRQPRFER